MLASMSVVEFISIIGSVAAVGIGLAVLILRSVARLDRRIDRGEDKLGNRIDGVEERLGRRIDGVEDAHGRRIDGVGETLGKRIDGVGETLGKRIDGVEKGQAELRERMAKLEGLLEGLREAISGRRAA